LLKVEEEKLKHDEVMNESLSKESEELVKSGQYEKALKVLDKMGKHLYKDAEKKKTEVLSLFEQQQ